MRGFHHSIYIYRGNKVYEETQKDGPEKKEIQTRPSLQKRKRKKKTMCNHIIYTAIFLLMNNLPF